VEELQQASHKLAEAMYQQAGAGASAGGGGAGPGAGGGEAREQASSKGAEDVVEAEFEEVKDKK
jgi:molecular chaperone DnaK